MKVILAKSLLKANSDVAKLNKDRLDGCKVKAINLISSPGTGKTTLLEKVLELYPGKMSVGVIEGDIATIRDAERIATKGVPVVQINTQGICHLDARMIEKALGELPLDQLELVIIENVGNLVCPAAFDLGEHEKIALLSVTEGDDKAAKYPRVFEAATAVIITKADLLPYIDFDLNACLKELLQINPRLKIFVTSAKTGSGLAEFVSWLFDE
ncbi:hydrogenase nickel incorporation protein HypB [Desulfotomaculum defluvii]